MTHMSEFEDSSVNLKASSKPLTHFVVNMCLVLPPGNYYTYLATEIICGESFISHTQYGILFQLININWHLWQWIAEETLFQSRRQCLPIPQSATYKLSISHYLHSISFCSKMENGLIVLKSCKPDVLILAKILYLKLASQPLKNANTSFTGLGINGKTLKNQVLYHINVIHFYCLPQIPVLIFGCQVLSLKKQFTNLTSTCKYSRTSRKRPPEMWSGGGPLRGVVAYNYTELRLKWIFPH